MPSVDAMRAFLESKRNIMRALFIAGIRVRVKLTSLIGLGFMLGLFQNFSKILAGFFFFFFFQRKKKRKEKGKFC